MSSAATTPALILALVLALVALTLPATATEEPPAVAHIDLSEGGRPWRLTFVATADADLVALLNDRRQVLGIWTDVRAGQQLETPRWRLDYQPGQLVTLLEFWDGVPPDVSGLQAGDSWPKPGPSPSRETILRIGRNQFLPMLAQ